MSQGLPWIVLDWPVWMIVFSDECEPFGTSRSQVMVWEDGFGSFENIFFEKIF